MRAAQGPLRAVDLTIGKHESPVPLIRDAAFEGWLVQGTYVADCQYPLPSGGFATHRIDLLEIKVPLENFVLRLPWVSALDVMVLDAESGKPDEIGAQWVIARGKDGLRDGSRITYDRMLTPGEYSILVCAEGRVPAREVFTVAETDSSTKVTVKMARGDAGIVAGRVIGRKTRLPVHANVSITNDDYEMDLGFQICPDGKFKFNGLPAGKYTIEAYPETGESRKSTFPLADLEKIENLVIEVETE